VGGAAGAGAGGGPANPSPSIARAAAAAAEELAPAAPPLEEARVFAGLEGAQEGLLLLDAKGQVLGGALKDPQGRDVAAAVAAYGPALDLVTRVRGVRGAMLVSGEDGIVVAEQLMEGIKGGAVAALAASLAARLRRAIDAAGVGPTLFWHLQCDKGGLLVVPTPSGVRIVAVAEPDVNVGLVRLELLRAAEAVG